MNKGAMFLSTITTSMMLATTSSSGMVLTNNTVYNKVSYVSSSSSEGYSLNNSNSISNNGNMYSFRKTKIGIINAAKEMLGDMRDLDSEEEEACYSALYNMSEDTGVKLF